MARHGRHCCIAKSQGGYSFGLFKYDSFRVVSGYRPNMGYLRLTAGLMFCLCGFPLTLPCPYPAGDSSFVYCGEPIPIKDFKPISYGANEQGVLEAAERFMARGHEDDATLSRQRQASI